MKDPAIVAEGLAKRFGEVRALDGVDLELQAGAFRASSKPAHSAPCPSRASR